MMREVNLLDSCIVGLERVVRLAAKYFHGMANLKASVPEELFPLSVAILIFAIFSAR